ncbi:MAG TPA: hypothetical protein EYP68_07190 [Candidatus Korarchaeota archaeon]|nr:hypothetical protein [Candidatus Korarchaeota archaeon]
MVLAGKLFKLEERVPLELIAEKLKGWKMERVEEYGGKEIKLESEVRELDFRKDLLWGVFSEDKVIPTTYRGELRYNLFTRESGFFFTEKEGITLLFVVEKWRIANNIASKLGEIIIPSPGAVVEAKIAHETLKELHESNPEATKVIYFDQVDLPNINKLALYGNALQDTTLYHEYLKHGKIWYVVFEDKKYGLVVGLTRNCVVTIFSKIDEETFINYVLERIVPLMERE